MAQRPEASRHIYDVAAGLVMRRFRGDLRMSQKEMGLFLGAGSQTVISNIEVGERPVLASEIWDWSKLIATRHPLSEDKIREEFFGPFVDGIASISESSDIPSYHAKAA